MFYEKEFKVIENRSTFIKRDRFVNYRKYIA